MSRFYSYINTSETIIDLYKGDVPFSIFIKSYFASNKKFGSKDRKQISSLCYNFFRLGKAAKELAVEEKILTGIFLCENKSNELLDNLRPEWNALIEQSIDAILSNNGSLFDFRSHVNDLLNENGELLSLGWYLFSCLMLTD